MLLYFIGPVLRLYVRSSQKFKVAFQGLMTIKNTEFDLPAKECF